MAANLRRTLIQIHLIFAAIMAPAFLFVALSGGMYLIGVEANVDKTAIALPSDTRLDFKSASLEADVRALLQQQNIDYDFEYIRNRGKVIQLRPTSRRHIEITQTDAAPIATWNSPNLPFALIELHKGHGPSAFKTYQKFVAATLMIVVLGGLIVGLLAPALRRRTIVATLVGTGLFVFLAFL